jgi:hypothetical protein
MVITRMASDREVGVLQGLSLALLAVKHSRASPKVLEALRNVTEQVELSVATQDLDSMKLRNSWVGRISKHAK